MERGVIGTDEAVVVFENMRVVELEPKSLNLGKKVGSVLSVG